MYIYTKIWYSDQNLSAFFKKNVWTIGETPNNSVYGNMGALDFVQ